MSLESKINELEDKLVILDYRIEKLSKQWYKPVLLNVGAGIAFLTLFFMYVSNEQDKQAVNYKEAQAAQTNIFSIRYDNLVQILAANQKLTDVRIKNTDEDLKEFKNFVNYELQKRGEKP